MSDITKKALARTLKELMNLHCLEKITIKQLTGACGVNRQTFYYHFRDIYDLLYWIYQQEIIKPLSHYRCYARWREGLTLVFTFLEDNKGFCLNSYRALGRAQGEALLNQFAFECLRDVVEELAREKKLPCEKKDFIARFYGDGFSGLLVRWLEQGAPGSGHDLVEDLSRLVEGDLARAIKKMALPAPV
ncbi:MAG: TetR/AcrR family transcriptional regulator C-terminal domain-containing protein [Spirochaetales bacterium]|nr:TetR/AcrR family transcriptional regulator C-terminal domain-containing protein [Spirochaetales bacterium]